MVFSVGRDTKQSTWWGQGLAEHTYLVHERRRGHQDDLEHPEADVRERREGVVADVLAARLAAVADELALLVVVDGLSADGRQHDAEHDEDGQPDLAHERGVVVDFFQQASQETPAHGNGGKRHRGAAYTSS
uniref:Uncharacterized protein n=1 Tax=Salarias fasciatus TaxID=181472 RepID=A0A672F673_SALFA